MRPRTLSTLGPGSTWPSTWRGCFPIRTAFISTRPHRYVIKFVLAARRDISFPCVQADVDPRTPFGWPSVRSLLFCPPCAGALPHELPWVKALWLVAQSAIPPNVGWNFCRILRLRNFLSLWLVSLASATSSRRHWCKSNHRWLLTDTDSTLYSRLVYTTKRC